MKIYFLTLSLLTILFSFACENSTESTSQNIYQLQIGDCFIFNSEELNHFGLILIDLKQIQGITEFGFAPVKFAEESIGKFEFGQVYLNKFMDYTENKEVFGMSVFHIRGNSELEGLLKLITKEDQRILKEKYRNITGGTISLTNFEFKRTLSKWKTIFGSNAELINLSNISSTTYNINYQKNISDCLKNYKILDFSNDTVYLAIECLNENKIIPSLKEPNTRSLILQMDANYPIESRKLWMICKNLDEGKIKSKTE